LIVPPEWAAFRGENLQGTILVLGASDTGKSTLARYLFQEIGRRGLRPAYLDSDMGQSTLGLPATLNLGLARAAGDETFPPGGPRAAYFVGAITPRGHMLPTVVGCKRLQDKALSLGADAIVVDTNGLVDRAQGGKALKEWKIELLAPALVVALQRTSELEPILWPLRREGRLRLLELRVSPQAAERTRERRIAHRRERLAGYFQQARPHLLALQKMPVYDLEYMAPGALLALQDAEGLCLGLGVVEELDRRAGTAVTLRSPLSDLDRVASVRLGPVRWDLAREIEL
jgi:polynucleotide 5'-hydroxyl-kinase GRC3/NOL9